MIRGMDRKLPWHWTNDVDAPDEDRMGIIINIADEVVASDLTLADAAFIVYMVNRVAGIVCTCEWDDACRVPDHAATRAGR